MRLLLLSFFILTLANDHVRAQEEVLSFKNVREGKSYYSKFMQTRTLRRASRDVTKEEALSIYNEALGKQNKKNLCAYDLNAYMKAALKDKKIEVDFKGLVYVLREHDEIDDVVAKILLTADEVKTTDVYTFTSDKTSFPDDSEKTKSQLEVIAAFEKKFPRTVCFDEAYRSYHSEILKLNKKTKSEELQVLHLRALEKKLISQDAFIILEQGRISKLESTTLSLSTYQQKLKTLRTQYPLRNLKERSDFTGTAVKKMKSSRRQKLFEQYSDLQIIMMGNVIKKLRARLEYDSVQISGYRSGVLQETIPLDPMERFRFAIKILRKEMSLLALNSYFNGRTPEYLDLMMASYEIGIIPASELDAVVSLESVWSPKKTFWDKAGIWVKTCSSVATIAIPPPYGFIPALVIVVIEATVGKTKDPNQNDPTVLF